MESSAIHMRMPRGLPRGGFTCRGMSSISLNEAPEKSPKVCCVNSFMIRDLLPNACMS
jgi:hypothetical protein